MCNFKNGFAFKSGLFKDSGLPIVRITNVDGKDVDLSNVKYFDPSDYTSGSPLNYAIVKGDVLIAMSGATTGKIGYFNSDETAYLNQRVGKFEPRNEMLNNRYLYHFLLTKASFLYTLAGGGAQPNLSSNNLKEKLLVPIPCPDDPEKSLAIQAEIVRILDTFTELTAELTTELTSELNARKKQYNYYREQLLSFKEGEVEWKPLGEACLSISAGGDVPKNSVKGQAYPTEEHPFPIFANATGSKGLYGYTDRYKIDSDAVTISARGAKVGYHTVREAKFTPIIRLIVLVPDKSKILNRYLNYALNMTPIDGTKGGIPQLTVPTVKKITIPIPYANDPKRSLVEQARIVTLLDKFDTLTNSISEGLPREIELRQKQYEYYRDLLLSFPKPEVEGGV
ncbi:restriction endonuclease subunit S [Photobacterium angustum]|uniref:restriction endonuclease subunit S n=1 Tax=Photobacterium angustum TaxID=661 RepID=UPI003D108336